MELHHQLRALVAGPLITAAKPAGITRRYAIIALAGATVGATATVVFTLSRSRGATPRHVTRIPILLPEGVVADASWNRRVAISADGTRIAYNAGVGGRVRISSISVRSERWNPKYSPPRAIRHLFLRTASG